MAFTEKLPEWNNQGSEPPQAKKDAGWEVREKPPASYFNWLFNRIFACLSEIFTKGETTEGAVAKVKAHADLKNNPHEVKANQVNITDAENLYAATEVEGALAEVRKAIPDNMVAESRVIATTEGLTGGGNLSADRTLKIADGGVTDAKIGDRTVDDTITAPAASNTGKLTVLLSWIVKMIKSITGKAHWYDTPSKSLEDVATHLTDLAAHNNVLMPVKGGTFTGIAKAHPNTSHSVAQMHNVIISEADADGTLMNEGDIWIKLKPLA